MNRWWWIAGLAGSMALVVAAALLYWSLRPPVPEWTTRSPEALGAYEQGIDDLARFYWADAVPHFERAVELDPHFAAAKLQLLLIHAGSPAERERRIEELANIDIKPLTPREQFLIAYWRARFASDFERADALLESYLASSPKDPWAISTRCDVAWESESWDAAEACYRRLIELHPNWVLAQNRLGLIAMARGQFKEAEEHFRTYGYIAPNQAAPWDSLGQLLAVRGRYEEAAKAFDSALEVKDDYCFAWWNLAGLESMRGHGSEAAARLVHLGSLPTCRDEYQGWGLLCMRRAWSAYLEGDLERAQGSMDAACLEQRGGFDFVAHRLALATGDLEQARRLEQALDERLQEKREKGDAYLFYGNFLRAVGLHLAGMRHFVEGDLETACHELGEAHRGLLFWGLDRGAFKLFNLRQLEACYEAVGETASAARAREELDGINPRYRAEYRVPELPMSER